MGLLVFGCLWGIQVTWQLSLAVCLEFGAGDRTPAAEQVVFWGYVGVRAVRSARESL